jgi:hypothetical protein
MTRRVRLHLEHLEDRQVPATFGVPWTDPHHLSVSFVRDGTDIGGTPSTLFRTMQALSPTGAWQRDILRAIQTWSNVANLSVGLVSDNGAPLGTPASPDGSTGFGTIRIAAKPLPGNVLAIGIPPDTFSSGTWTGEIIFNTNANLTAQKTDLYTVFLHEVGHALGLAGSADTRSVMFQQIQGKRTGLSTLDRSAITSLYGSRLADANEIDDHPNDTLKRASRLKYEDDGSDAWTGTTPLVAFGDITEAKDVDLFSFRNLGNYSGPATFRVLSSGISLLNARLSILDSKGKVLATAVKANPVGGGEVSIRLPQLTRGATYYVKVMAASATETFAIGRYGLALTLDQRITTSLAAINEVLRGPYESIDSENTDELFSSDPDDYLIHQDDHTDDTALLAERMDSSNSLGTAFQAVGSIQDATDVDYYRVRGPRTALTTATLTVTPLQTNGIMPQVELLDATQRPVPLTILTNGNGVLVLQATGLRPGSDSYLRVSNVPNQTVPGNYNVDVRFSAQSTTLETFVNATISGTAFSRLFIAEPQLFHLLLSTTNGVGVTLTIRDLSNRVLYTLSSTGPAASGQPLLLQPGEYRVEYSNASNLSAQVNLRGLPLSDPIGAVVINPTQRPPYQTPGQPGSNTYPTGTVTTRPFLFSSVGM